MYQEDAVTKNAPGRVVFKDHSKKQDGIALPDPRLLRLHAALVGVLNMSGASEIFEKFSQKRHPEGPAVPAFGEDFIVGIGKGTAVLEELRDSISLMGLYSNPQPGYD